MARYFHFKHLDELCAQAVAFGDTLVPAHDLSPLFQALTVQGRTLGNRLCIQPMEGCDGTLAGAPDELTLRRYRRFGAGGAKLIWGEATAVCEEGRMNPRQLFLCDETASALETMLADCRRAHRDQCGRDDDLLIGLQLTHSGRYSFRKPLVAVHCPLLDPRTIDKSSGRALDESYPLLTDDDLRRIENQFLNAARLAQKIGCDFIDLKQCHRYLLSELLGAKTRTGPYGGSLENRTRLARNIVTAIRQECPQLIIASRINVFDGVPFQKRPPDNLGVPAPFSTPVDTAFGVNPYQPLDVDFAEPLAVTKLLADAGVRLLNITLGNPYANPHYVRPAEFAPIDGYQAPEHPLIGVLRHFRSTEAVQRSLPDVPVVGSGYSWLQEFFPAIAAGNIAAGRCALVGVGRGSLSQPDFARQIQDQGRLDRKRICRTFSYCTNLMRSKNHPLGQFPTGCPPFDKEAYDAVWKEIQQQQS
ncbi:MAG: NADH:flavin oxidoreductase [Planctomycetaceae bacterium]